MPNVSRIIRLWVAFGCVFLTGCSSKEVTDSDIVGIWVETQGAGTSRQTVGCAVFEFRQDGTFRADNFPREYFISKSAPSTPRVWASGTWHIRKAGGTQSVILYIDPNPQLTTSNKVGSYLQILDDRAELTLSAWAFHDENDGIYFVKRNTADCPS